MNALRLHWDIKLGWLLDVPFCLTKEQLNRVSKWAMPIQIDRYNSLPLGDKKDELKNAIKDLQNGKIQQRLIDHNNDGIYVPFSSTERTNTIKYNFWS